MHKKKKKKKWMKYMKNENIMIQINIHIQHNMCLTDFAIWRTYAANYKLFPLEHQN